MTIAAKSFSLTIDQVKDAQKFIDNHHCTLGVDELGFKRVGAIASDMTYCFTPTSIGIVETVKCSCGETSDLTCYGDW